MEETKYGRFRTEHECKISGSHAREPNRRRGSVQCDRPVGHHDKPVCMRRIHDRRGQPRPRGKDQGIIHGKARV